MLQALLDEFKGLTNQQAYELAFHKKMMRTDPSRPGFFLGNTQREDFLGYLQPLVRGLPKDAQIFDFGAGAGDIVDLALKNVTATVNLEEPNSLLLAQYRKRIIQSPNLKLGICHNGPIQDYWSGNNPEPPRPAQQQDLALAIHIIYHLTDCMRDAIDADADIKQAISAMYSFLKPGAVLFIVFADQLISTTGLAVRYYFQQNKATQAVQNLLEICQSRDRLLREGLVKDHLDKHFPDSTAVLTTHTTKSYIYGNTKDDIAAMCLTAEVGETNDAAFDLEKLEILTRFVDTHQQAIGLTIEHDDRPQKNMIRANQPQVITLIKRDSHGELQ